jgi:hypothetical protein
MRNALLIPIALAACATARPPAWVPGTSPYIAEKAGFEVAVPAGWMRRNITARELLIVTRDGTSLQRILVGSSELGKPLGITESKRAVTAEMSPQEIAEVLIDGLNSSRAWTEINVIENAPAMLSGQNGFRLLAAFRDEDGLMTRLAACGASAGGRFYWLIYIAPERHYYGLDLGTFEEMVSSFRIRNVPSA